MHLTTFLCAASVVALCGCATAGAPASAVSEAQQSSQGCPLPGEGPRYSISVADHTGRAVGVELRETIAHAIAHVWGVEEPRVRNWPRYLQVLRELKALVPDQPFHMHNKWRVRDGDSAVALLTYRGGQVPELDIPQQGLRKEFREWITTAVGRAIARSMNGRAEGTPMPLQLPEAGDKDVTLELRFGWRPGPGAAVAAFARQEREPWPQRGNRGPRYPDEYRLQNLEGEVMVGFIIDETGRVEPGTIRLIWSDGTQFTTSVRTALPAMRFDPLMIDCVVRPMVGIQPFNFSLVR